MITQIDLHTPRMQHCAMQQMVVFLLKPSFLIKPYEFRKTWMRQVDVDGDRLVATHLTQGVVQHFRADAGVALVFAHAKLLYFPPRRPLVGRFSAQRHNTGDCAVVLMQNNKITLFQAFSRSCKISVRQPQNHVLVAIR